ncbi:MAG: hypothetical protein R3C05_23475 [Pirellulaceae bacterium]
MTGSFMLFGLGKKKRPLTASRRAQIEWRMRYVVDCLTPLFNASASSPIRRFLSPPLRSIDDVEAWQRILSVTLTLIYTL